MDRQRSLHRIAHSTSVLAATTAVSRLLGFVRDLVIAKFFGTTSAAQAFVVAFRIPNMMRDLVAEGAVTSAFVPVLSGYRAKAQLKEFWHLSEALFARLLVILCAIGIIGWVFATALVYGLAPGFASDPEKFALTVRLTRILFPLILLVGLWAYFMGLLNSLQHFTMPSLGPAIMNVAMIVACIGWVHRVSPGILALAIGVMVGGLLQVLIQLPTAIRLGWRWHWRWRHTGSSRIVKLLAPRMLGSAVHQGNVFIHTALASLGTVVGEGSVVALYFANRLMQLPLALFGTASAQASLPALAEQAAENDLAAFRSTLLSVLRMVGFVILPSAMGLIVLAEPMVHSLFERGAFDHQATILTTQALAGYSLGLLSYSISKVLSGAFYALQDTWTPVRLAVQAVAVNVGLSVALMYPLHVGGLALASALSNTVNAYQLLRGMERRLNKPLLSPLLGSWVRMLAASLLMGVGCWALWTYGSLNHRPIVGIPVVILCSLAFYLVCCRMMGIPELATSLRWLRRFRQRD